MLSEGPTLGRSDDMGTRAIARRSLGAAELALTPFMYVGIPQIRAVLEVVELKGLREATTSSEGPRGLLPTWWATCFGAELSLPRPLAELRGVAPINTGVQREGITVYCRI